MEEDACKAFRRNGDGWWTCVAQTTLIGLDRRARVVEPGAVFAPADKVGGFDIVDYLERCCGRAGDRH